MKTIKTLILALILFVMSHIANAQNHNNSICRCDQPGYGCLTLQYNCRIYCQDYCAQSDFCRKHPKKCARMSNTSFADETSLTTIYPNPVLNSTTISFSLSQSEIVSLKIYDMTGRLVTTLTDATFEEGNNEIVWNANDVNAGIYFLRMEAGSYSAMEKFSVIK